MDGIIIIILIVVACVYFRRLDKGVYSIAIIDICLRILNYLITHVEIKGATDFLSKYLPKSIPAMIKHYTSGVMEELLIWVYVILMGIFLFYIIKAFIKKK